MKELIRLNFGSLMIALAIITAAAMYRFTTRYEFFPYNARAGHSREVFDHWTGTARPYSNEDTTHRFAVPAGGCE